MIDGAASVLSGHDPGLPATADPWIVKKKKTAIKRAEKWWKGLSKREKLLFSARRKALLRKLGSRQFVFYSMAQAMLFKAGKWSEFSGYYGNGKYDARVDAPNKRQKQKITATAIELSTGLKTTR